MDNPHPELSQPGALLPRRRPRAPAAGLRNASLALAPAVPALALWLVGPVPEALALALAGFAAGAWLAIRLMRRGYPHDALGLCNIVTLVRLALAAALLAPLLAPEGARALGGWAVFAIAALALALDGVDGWLARRTRRVSGFGARFDMEVDAAFGLVLALNAWEAESAGVAAAAVLMLGLPRYLFLVAGAAWRWMRRPLPERFGRKLACVVQLAALIALQAPGLGGPAAQALVAGAGAVLGWSFGRDMLWLWRNR